MGLDYGALIGAGLGLTGGILQGQQANRANQLSQQNANRLFDLAAQEQARKDALTRSFLPSVMFGMGNSNPIGAAKAAYPMNLPTSGSSQFSPSNVYGQNQGGGPGIGSSLISAGATAAPLIMKGLGVGAKAAGTAAGTGGGIGSAVTGALPWAGPAAAAGLGAMAWLKSQAHWEANDVVKNLQNPYKANVLDKLQAGLDSGSISPQQGVQELDRKSVV